MRKRIITLGVLAGGVALAGLAGSAYGETSHKAEPLSAAQRAKAALLAKELPAGKKVPPGTVAPGKPGFALACVAPGAHLKGKPAQFPGKGPDQGKVTIKVPGAFPPPGKAVAGLPEKVTTTHGKLPAPPPGAKGITKVIAKDGRVHISAPKGVHCTQVKPGTLPPLPKR